MVSFNSLCIVFYYTQSEEFDVYVNYARTYEEAVTVLQTFIETDEAVDYLKVIIRICMSTVHAWAV